MSFSLTDFAYQACRDIGCLRAGTSALQATDVLNDILTAANQLIDADRINELMAFAYPASIFPLQSLLEQYKIGPGQAPPNFNAQRPTGITEANVIIQMSATPQIRKPLALWNKTEYAQIRVRATPPGSTAPIGAIPDGIYYDNDFNEATGYATLNFWPAPQNTPQSVELFTTETLPFLSFADLTTPYNFPPAYARYMRKALACEIWPMMWDRWKAHRIEGLQAPSEAMIAKVERQYIEAKAAIMSDNAPDAVKWVDRAFVANERRGGWNYGIGSYGRGTG